MFIMILNLVGRLKMISDNEKIALIAKMAIHCPEHQGTNFCIKVPDMSELSNIIKALETRQSYELKCYHPSGYECLLDPIYSWNGVMDDYSAKGEGRNIIEAISNAFLKLYEMNNV